MSIDSLRKSGYKTYLLCDDEDKTTRFMIEEKYKDKVLVFSKKEYASFDKMDNFGNKACVVYAT